MCAPRKAALSHRTGDRGQTTVSILSLHYPPETTGNAPYTGGLASGLRLRGHRVEAFVAQPHYPEWRIRQGYDRWRSTEMLDGVKVHRLRHLVPRPPRGLRRLLSEISFGIRLGLSRCGSADVVVAVSPALFATAMALVRLRLNPRRPALVVWVQDIYTLGIAETGEGSCVSAAITKFVEKHTLRSADRVVAIHPRFKEYMVAELGVPADRVSVIRNWTHLQPVDVISKRVAREALNWPSGTLLAVHTGNMGSKQGLDNVVEAARLADVRNAPLKFILVGDGGERSRLECMAQGVNSIEFVDPLNAADYRYALAAADCLLVNEMPGVANMAVPSKLTSYFDAMRPIVAASDPQGITASEIKLANGGIVVPAGDPEALLAAVLDLAQNGEVADAYGAAGQSYCRRMLTAEAAMTAFDRVILDLADRRRG
ncbi:glycosyltransferase family 4 protein [Mycolicibacterium sp. 22603]|uniref:glycosyltransferase family 4 protein n=1 Tax=Mycolicibacterium sp. 22603 TaxID=3453950 RepID=UPI003F8760A4